MRAFFFLFILILLLLHNTCTENPINGDDNILPGRRDYTWELDTLSRVTPNYFVDIGGTSANNVWLVTDSYNIDENLLHFDGENWKAVQATPRQVAAASVFGITPDGLWIGGSYSDFWKFNGITFEFYGEYVLEGYLTTIFLDIWGYNNNDLYAAGTTRNIANDSLFSTLIHYDGNDWEYLVRPDLLGQFHTARKTQQSPFIYLLNLRPNLSGSDVYEILEYNNGSFRLLHSNEENPNDGPWLEVLGDEIYFAWEKRLYFLQNNNLVLYKDLSGSLVDHNKFFGRSKYDIFFKGFGGIVHYNGNNVELIYPINEDFVIIRAISFSQEIFILLHNRINTSYYVLRGYLD